MLNHIVSFLFILLPQDASATIEHCIYKDEVSEAFCFLEVVTENKVRLKTKVSDFTKLLAVPLMHPTPQWIHNDIFNRVQFIIEIISDDRYRDDRINASGGFLHDFSDLDISTTRGNGKIPDAASGLLDLSSKHSAKPFGFESDLSQEQQNLPMIADPYVMECSGRCWNGVVGTMMEHARAGIKDGAALGSSVGLGVGTLLANKVAWTVGGGIAGGIFGAVYGAVEGYNIGMAEYSADESVINSSAPKEEIENEEVLTEENACVETSPPPSNENQSTPLPDSIDPSFTDATKFMYDAIGLQVIKQRLENIDQVLPFSTTVDARIPPVAVKPEVGVLDLLILHDNVAKEMVKVNYQLNIKPVSLKGSLINPGGFR